MAVKQLIERIELDSSAATVTFSSIPQTFAHLQILVSARSDRAANVDDVLSLNFNSDTSNQSSVLLRGSGSSVTSFSVSTLRLANANASNTTSNTFSNISAYVTNYTASQGKSVSSDFAMENNGTLSFQGLVASLWDNNSAVTSITLDFIEDFVSGCTFSLYGITRGGDGTVTTA